MLYKTLPFDHQVKCFERFKDAPYCAILADMGTGKSKIAIDLAAYKYYNELSDRVLIIAPVSVHPQWITEQFPLHCAPEWEGFSYSSNKSIKYLKQLDAFIRKETTKLKVFTINFEAFARDAGKELALRFFKTSSKPPIIIIDEASRIKNPEAKSVVNIKKLAKLFPDSFRYVLTGTPAAKRPTDMWSIYDFLQHNYMQCSYLAFTHEHCVQVKQKLQIKGRLVSITKVIDKNVFDRIRGMVNKNIALAGRLTPAATSAVQDSFGISSEDLQLVLKSRDVVRFKNLDALQKKIAPVTFSIKKSECLELPEKIYKEEYFDLNSNQKELIKQLIKYSATTYNGEELTLSVKALLGIRALQICGGFFAHHTDIEGKYATTAIEGPNAKLNYILSDLEEIGEQQFLIFAVFIDEINLLYNALSKDYNVACLAGETDKNDRVENIESFKKGEIQGLIVHPLVGGYGLNLQNAGIQYWYSRDYRTEARLQAEDRSHRSGITKSPIYKDLLYNFSFEKEVLSVLKSGKDINDLFMSAGIDKLFQL